MFKYIGIPRLPFKSPSNKNFFISFQKERKINWNESIKWKYFNTTHRSYANYTLDWIKGEIKDKREFLNKTFPLPRFQKKDENNELLITNPIIKRYKKFSSKDRKNNVAKDKVFQILRQKGIPDETIWKTLISSCGQNHAFDMAQDFFLQMKNEGIKPDIETWNSILHMCEGDLSESKLWVEEMKKEGVKPNKDTWNSLISACSVDNDHESAENFLSQMRSSGIKPDIDTWNSMLNVYVMNTEKAQKTFDEMKKEVTPNVDSWNALIAAYVEKKKEKVEEIYEKMKSAEVQPNADTWNIIISKYQSEEILSSFRNLIEKMKADNVEPNGDTWNILIGTCCSEGFGKEAETILTFLQEEGYQPDIRHWNAIIDCYAQDGKEIETLKAFSNLRKQGLKPDYYSWGSLVTLYTSLGDPVLAFDIVLLMKENDISPTNDMIRDISDLLGELEYPDLQNQLLGCMMKDDERDSD